MAIFQLKVLKTLINRIRSEIEKKTLMNYYGNYQKISVLTLQKVQLLGTGTKRRKSPPDVLGSWGRNKRKVGKGGNLITSQMDQ